MIEITTGFIVTLISAVGILGCLIALIVTKPIYKRQRNRLLREIEEE